MWLRGKTRLIKKSNVVKKVKTTKINNYPLHNIDIHKECGERQAP